MLLMVMLCLAHKIQDRLQRLAGTADDFEAIKAAVDSEIAK